MGACLKHFFANNQETRRRTQSSNLDERTIREIYTPAFETAIEKGKPWAVMTSYNKVNGKYVNEDSQYCIDLLKGEFGFDGLVVSDWAAVHDRVAVIRGGTELTMPADKANDKLLVDAVKNGTLKESELDAACADIIAIALRGTEARKETAEYNFEVAHFQYQLSHKLCAMSKHALLVVVRSKCFQRDAFVCIGHLYFLHHNPIAFPSFSCALRLFLSNVWVKISSVVLIYCTPKASLPYNYPRLLAQGFVRAESEQPYSWPEQ